jgi:hypothetical protein
MNTSLKLIALSLAAALPGSVALTLAGATLPSAFDPLHVLGAFVVAVVLLTIFGDYGRQPKLAATAAQLRQRACRGGRAQHPLAA